MTPQTKCRKAETYRGARRNAARADRKLARAEKRQPALIEWQFSGRFAQAANVKAKIDERAALANEATKHVAAALVAAGPLAGHSVATDAFLKFYTAPERTPRSRAVNRIIKGLRADARRKSI